MEISFSKIFALLADKKKNISQSITKFCYVFLASILLLLIVLSGFFSLSKVNTNFNSFTWLTKLFSLFFTNFQQGSLTLSRLPTIWTFYLLIGLAIVLSFRSGIFNLNVSGQLIVSGSLVINLLHYFEEQNGPLHSGHLLLGLFVSILGAALCSLVVGVLKTFFNIHEVVGSIFLNWIVFYFAKNSFSYGRYADFSASGRSKNLSLESFENFWGSSVFHWFLFVLALFLALVFLVIFKKTALGYRMEINKLSEGALSYSGYNRHLLILGVTFFSGCITGAAAFVLYVIQEHFISIGIMPTAKGFAAIGISLLANHSSIGIILTSWFFANLDINIPYVTTSTLEISDYIQELIQGVFTFVVAISSVFLQFNILKRFKLFYIYLREDPKFLNKFFAHKAKNTKIFIRFFRKWADSMKTKIKLWVTSRSINKEINSSIQALTKEIASKKQIDSEIFKTLLEKQNKARLKLESLGYFKSEEIFNDYWLSKRKEKERFWAYKQKLLQKYFATQAQKPKLLKEAN